MSTCEYPFEDSIWDFRSDFFSCFVNLCNFILFVSLLLVSFVPKRVLILYQNNRVSFLWKILLMILFLWISKQLYNIVIIIAYFFACGKYRWLVLFTLSYCLAVQVPSRLRSYFSNETRNEAGTPSLHDHNNEKDILQQAINGSVDDSIRFVIPPLPDTFVADQSTVRGALLGNVAPVNNFPPPEMQITMRQAAINSLMNLAPDTSSLHPVTKQITVTRCQLSTTSEQPGPSSDSSLDCVVNSSEKVPFSPDQVEEFGSKNSDDEIAPEKRSSAKKKALKRQINYHPPKRRKRGLRAQPKENASLN